MINNKKSMVIHAAMLLLGSTMSYTMEKKPPDMNQIAQDLMEVQQKVSGSADATTRTRALAKAKNGSREILSDPGIDTARTKWSGIKGTAVEEFTNNTNYYFVAFTRNLDGSDPAMRDGKYAISEALSKKGATLIPPHSKITFPVHALVPGKALAIAVIGYSSDATTAQQNAFLEGRLPAGVMIFDTRQEFKGEKACGAFAGYRVRVEFYVIINKDGSHPNDRQKRDCFYLCGTGKAKRLSITINKYAALTGTPEGKWHAPTTLMNDAININAINDSLWMAKYTQAAPRGKAAAGC